MSTLARAIILLSCSLAAACSGDDGDRLERPDVDGLPVGTATGAAATGSYELTLVTTACAGSCRISTISLCDVNDADDASVEVTQDDGALVMLADGLVLDRLSGGLDADGQFLVGGWGTEQGGDVEILVQSQGTVADGHITGTATARAHGSYDGHGFDCTTVADVTGDRAP